MAVLQKRWFPPMPRNVPHKMYWKYCVQVTEEVICPKLQELLFFMHSFLTAKVVFVFIIIIIIVTVIIVADIPRKRFKSQVASLDPTFMPPRPWEVSPRSSDFTWTLEAFVCSLDLFGNSFWHCIQFTCVIQYRCFNVFCVVLFCEAKHDIFEMSSSVFNNTVCCRNEKLASGKFPEGMLWRPNQPLGEESYTATSDYLGELDGNPGLGVPF